MKLTKKMCDYCHKNEAKAQCEGCYEDCCDDCLVSLTVHNMIDFPLCKTCYEIQEDQLKGDDVNVK